MVVAEEVEVEIERGLLEEQDGAAEDLVMVVFARSLLPVLLVGGFVAVAES